MSALSEEPRGGEVLLLQSICLSPSFVDALLLVKNSMWSVCTKGRTFEPPLFIFA